MRNWLLPSTVLYPEPDAGTGSGTIAIDPGIPYEHGQEPEPAPVKKEKTDADKRLEALEQELKDIRRRANDAEEDARFWQKKAASQPLPEPDDDPEPPVPIDHHRDEKPEKLLDDIGTEGLDALKKRGFVTKAEMQQLLHEQEQRTEARIATARADAEFGGRIAAEFPEIAEDSRRIDRGEKPQSELFKRTGEIYRAAVAEDPSLKGSKGLLLMAARQAQAEMKRGKETAKPEPQDERPDRQSERRRRIDDQRPVRSAASDETDERPSFSAEQMAVMKNLGVKPEAFQRHAKGK